jgi:hypothetical protein
MEALGVAVYMGGGPSLMYRHRRFTPTTNLRASRARRQQFRLDGIGLSLSAMASLGLAFFRSPRWRRYSQRHQGEPASYNHTCGRYGARGVDGTGHASNFHTPASLHGPITSVAALERITPRSCPAASGREAPARQEARCDPQRAVGDAGSDVRFRVTRVVVGTREIGVHRALVRTPGKDSLHSNDADACRVVGYA